MKMRMCVILALFYSIFAKSQNIQISSVGNPSEPSIFMDPKNPRYIVAGANISSMYYSQDTGRTWTRKTLSSTYGVWGDPSIICDTSGYFYFFHLSNPPSPGYWIDRIVCQRSTDKGSTWNNGTFTALVPPHNQDKQWCAVDRSNNNLYITWTEFDLYNSANALDSSRILFSRSTDAGNTWSTPTKINRISGDCIDSDNTVEGAVPAIGPNGEVYVSWVGPSGIVFDRSIDQGNTWLYNDIFVTSVPGGWDFMVPGVQRANGLPVTMCDTSGGSNNGNIYINWSDQRNGDTDVWLARSSDGGNTWSAPVKVNNDNTTTHQFFTWACIDQSNGDIYVVFYDRRNYVDNRTDVYIAKSSDGGITFTNWKISSTPFLPTNSVFFGDYTNITAHNGIVRPIWTRLHNGALSVWTDISINNGNFVTTSVEEADQFDNALISYPNPALDDFYISYKLRQKSMVSIEVFNSTGELVALYKKDQAMESGKYVETLNARTLNLRAGIYFIKVSVNGRVKLQKHVVE